MSIVMSVHGLADITVKSPQPLSPATSDCTIVSVHGTSAQLVNRWVWSTAQTAQQAVLNVTVCA